MTWSSRLLVLGCFIGGLQMAACLALLVPSPEPGADQANPGMAPSAD